MQRARETCAIAGFGDVANVDEGLKEWDYGVYEGTNTEEIQGQTPGWSVWKHQIVGGETVKQVGERADGVIAQALAAAAVAGRLRCLLMRIFCGSWRRGGLGWRLTVEGYLHWGREA